MIFYLVYNMLSFFFNYFIGKKENFFKDHKEFIIMDDFYG